MYTHVIVYSPKHEMDRDSLGISLEVSVDEGVVAAEEGDLRKVKMELIPPLSDADPNGTYRFLLASALQGDTLLIRILSSRQGSQAFVLFTPIVRKFTRGT